MLLESDENNALEQAKKGEIFMLNKVVLIGRLTKDPEARETQSGIAITNFTLAVNRNYKDENGDNPADFIQIVTWRGLAENCAKYLVKGRLAAVAGRIQTGSYEADDGTRRYTTDVVADEVKFLEWGERDESSPEGSGFSKVTPMGGSALDDGELPF